MYRAFRSSTVVLILLFSWLTASAQELTCQAVVESALDSISRSCANLARDRLCFSYPEVEVAAASGYSLPEQWAPADRLDLRGISSVTTGALDLDHGHWGAALFNLGVNLPMTHEGPGVIILLTGAAQIINETEAEQVVEFGEPLTTVALEAATRFKLPGVIPAPVGKLAADELLLVDAYDLTGEWLRDVTGGSVTWVKSEKLARLKAMESLPRLSVGQAFALQSFALSTGTGLPECDEAEPMLAIQTPEDMSINMTVNGVDIHIGSMVTFQQVHHNALSMTVHRGEATTIFGQTVAQGESVLGILGRTSRRDSEVLDWSGALSASPAELARGKRAQAAINAHAAASGWPQYETFSAPADLYYVVKRGDGLYAIARQFEASVAAIISANDIEEPFTLFVGMELLIPDPGSGFAGRWTRDAASAPGGASD